MLSRMSWARRLGLFLVVVALVSGGLVLEHRLSPKHLLEVEPGFLYRSATLPPEQLADVVDEYGIRTVVNLRSVGENASGDWHAREADVLAQRGVELIDLPVNSGWYPPDESLEGWLDVLEDENAGPILVHCEYGVIRTSLMVSIYKMEHHGEAFSEVWEDFELFQSDLEEPIHSRLENYLSDYVPRASVPENRL